MTKEMGVFIGRFQPLHLGHMAVINEIIAEGYEPLVLIGRPLMDANVSRYPLSLEQTQKQFEIVFEGISTEPIYDRPDDNVWMMKTLSTIDNICGIENACIFYTRKPEDIKNGKHYIDLLSPFIEVREALFPKKLGINISATEIRRGITNNAHYLDGRIYNHVRKQFINARQEA